MNTPLLSVKQLTKRFPVEGGLFRKPGRIDAVRGVSFDLSRGETLALVGESGSGKTTVAKMIQGILAPTSGEIFFGERESRTLSRKERAGIVQMIFQDPFASLNPKLSVGSMLKEALLAAQAPPARQALEAECLKLLASVGLSGELLHNYPHQFSGGQRQRLGIARALAARPGILIADEPVSALDLSIQAQILNLLADLKEDLGVSYLLIAHDLGVIEQMADRVLVMQSGEIVEAGAVETLFKNPAAEYTRNLLAAMPTLPAGGTA